MSAFAKSSPKTFSLLGSIQLIMEFARLWTIVFFVLGLFFSTGSVGIRRYESDLYENDFCGLDRSVYSGKCKKIKKCVHLLAEKKNIEICAFNGNAADETLVCCSREDFYKSRTLIGEGPLDYQTCLEQYKHLRPVVNDEEELSHFTVNGVEVKDGEFPHMAAIGWMKWDSFTVEWHCGGSLISETHVLTAAHCTSLAGRKPNIVRLGDNDLTSSDDDQNVQEFDISGIIKHPHYDASTNENDIAIIQIRESVVYGVQQNSWTCNANNSITGRLLMWFLHASSAIYLRQNILKPQVLVRTVSGRKPTSYQKFFLNLCR